LTSLWPWLVLIGLGAFHGLNPAMGWLFAVALGLYEKSRGVVLLSLVPIGLGHLLAIAAVVAAFMLLGAVIQAHQLKAFCGIALIACGAYHALYGRRHRVTIGLRTGFAGLALWSFLMASAHGAGLMLMPAVLPLQMECSQNSAPVGPLAISILAVLVHTASMLAVTGLVAIAVYDWFGLAFLRRGWINLDALWTVALIGAGLLILLV
jgi:hypothetical protein